ncbi:MAG: hypothetical protein CM15mV41_0520 [Caudoviricetes sp.]|nr:MAG: hypothetical protein CM15mV41_0520 [Caudoviricetes sp.]
MKQKKQCSEVSKTLAEFNVVGNLLKDSGIKSQIIKKYVPVFNNLINKYLQNMDFFVNFTLDEEFNEVIPKVDLEIALHILLSPKVKTEN